MTTCVGAVSRACSPRCVSSRPVAVRLAQVPLMKALDVAARAMAQHKAVAGVAMCGVYFLHGLAGKLSNLAAIKKAGVDAFVREAIVTHAAVGDVKKVGESLLSKIM